MLGNQDASGAKC